MQSEELTKILNQYELLRTRAHQERDARVRAVYDAYPELFELDQELNRCGFLNAKKIMQDPKNSAKYNEEFQKTCAELEQKKAELIQKNGIDPDYKACRFLCSDCEDTGFIGSKKCHCFEQKIIQHAYEDANLSEVMQEQEFSKFSLAYYSARKMVMEGVTERDMMERVLEKCKSFCKNFDSVQKSMLFFGDTGLGKTFLSSAIANELIQKNKTVLYIRATKLFNLYDDYKFSRAEDLDMERFYTADLLIIDDLGTEFLSKTSIPFLFDLVNERLSRNKKMIINTNLNMRSLTKTYSQRFVSRIYESFEILEFFGEDIRIKKFKQNL